MKKSLAQKVMLFLAVTIITITLLQSFSLAKSENVQMIKKSEKEYIIYVSNLIGSKFEFSFANKKDESKENLVFTNSALDQEDNGNNIAYIDETIYNNYFDGKKETYLWVKQGTEYKVEAEKINLKDALTEEDIQELNNATKKIPVKFGELNLPAETVDGVKITRRMGTINIEDNSETEYSYKMLKSTEESKVEELINLANEMNKLDEKNTYDKLSIYGQFKSLYEELKPSDGWNVAENNVIKQPQESKKGEQYLVWIKNEQTTDVQIMTCNDDYTPEYENKKIINKVITKLPITGESLALYITAAILIVLIVTVAILKVKNNKSNKNE
ncbi:MAG: hypothetical protein ACM67R_07080 [Clostridiales bacterium]